MLIKVNTNNVNDRDIILEKSGIAMAKRFLYLFVKVSDYHNNHNRPITTKAVLVNVSLRKSDKLDNYYRKHDGMMLTKNIYTFSVWLPEGIGNIPMGRFTLRNGYSSSYFSCTVDDHSNKSLLLPPIKYNHVGKKLNDRLLLSRDYDNLNEDFMYDAIYDMKNNSFETIVPPIYYSSEHMRNTSEDLYSLWNAQTDIYTGEDLIDLDHTKVTLLDKNMYPDMIKKLQTDTLEENGLEITSPYYIPVMTLDETTITSLSSGMTFIYDSKYKGIGIKGDIRIPYRKYINQNYLIKSLERYSIDFERACKMIEKKYGNLTLMYCPLEHSSKLKIDFKDHKINPMKSPNDLNVDSDTLLDLSFSEFLFYISIVDNSDERYDKELIGRDSECFTNVEDFAEEESSICLP